MTTARLNIPFVLPSQAQKHVTVNTALTMIDARVQLSAISHSITTPPTAPADGDTYLVPTGATGDWVGQDDAIAVFDKSAWTFVTPAEGWICYVTDTDRPYRYLSGWAPLPSADSLDQLGINGTADGYNRLLAQSEGVVFTHVGAHQRTTLNKFSPPDDAALSFQTDFTPHALTGLLGNDDYTVKVSGDGANFHQGFSIEKDTGTVSLGAVTNHSGSVTIHDAATPSLRLLTDGSDDVTLGFYNAGAPLTQKCEMAWSAATNGFSLSTNGTPALHISDNGTVSAPQTPTLSFSRNTDLAWGANTSEKIAFQSQRILQGNITINSAKDQIITPEAGTYLVSLRLTLINDLTASRDTWILELNQNGSNVIPAGSNLFCPNQPTIDLVKTPYTLTLPVTAAAGDTFEVWVSSINSDATLTGASIDFVKLA